jgi:Rrf2 family protein
MRRSSKGDYGLRAVFDLAQRFGEGLVPNKDIARRQGISPNYLSQLLLTLRQARLIQSFRGPRGGHRLARPPATITVYDVVVALEGPLLVVAHSQPAAAAADDRRIIGEVWHDMRTALQRVLLMTTIEDLCRRKTVRALPHPLRIAHLQELD